MNMSSVMDIFVHAMVIVLKIAAPILIISMAIGLLISIFQAATQIHEQTLTFVPKLVAIAVILLVLGGWMINTMVDFFNYICEAIVNMG